MFLSGKRYIGYIFVFILLNCTIIPNYSMAEDQLFSEEETNNILKSLEFSKLEKETSIKWENYIKHYTGFYNDEYQATIIRSGLEFAKSITALNQCTNDMENIRKQYSSEWMNEFKNRFDIVFIRNNIESIKFIVSGINAINNMKFCKEKERDVLYLEIQFRENLKYYLHKLHEFAKSLSDRERKTLLDRLASTQHFLDGPPYPMQVLLSHGNLRLFPVALESRKELDPKLIDFFSKYSLFQKPFDPIKAITDLGTFTSTDEIPPKAKP